MKERERERQKETNKDAEREKEAECDGEIERGIENFVRGVIICERERINEDLQIISRTI